MSLLQQFIMLIMNLMIHFHLIVAVHTPTYCVQHVHPLSLTAVLNCVKG